MGTKAALRGLLPASDVKAEFDERKSLQDQSGTSPNGSLQVRDRPNQAKNKPYRRTCPEPLTAPRFLLDRRRNRTPRPPSHSHVCRRNIASTQPRAEWAKARRIVVKIGSSLLVDRAQRRAQRGLARVAGRRRRRAGQGRQAGDRRLLRRHRARAATCWRLPKGALRARAVAGGGRRRPDLARQRLSGGLQGARADGRADPADARRYRGAPPLPQRPPDHRHAAGPARGARRQRERHGGHHARSATATTTACPRASPA